MTELTPPYQYDKGYITFPLQGGMFSPFPDTITYNDETLFKKSSFHVSLVYIKEISKVIPEDTLTSFFNDFVKKTPIMFDSFKEEFRFVVDGERGRKTIVLLCTMSNLEEFFRALNQRFNTNVLTQPAHVTLYTLQKDVGIGIMSPEKMTATKEINVPELSKAFVTLTS